jgi:lysozyme
MIRPIPEFLPAFLKGAEAVKTRAYQDGAGVWTIGVGHTGPEVRAGLVWPMTTIDIALGHDIETAANRLAAVVDEATILRLTEHEYGALLSFVFNLGEKPDWTIWKVLKKGDLGGVPDQMMRFDKARNAKTGALEVVPGLEHRRLAEKVLWNTGDVAAASAVIAAAPAAPPPSSFTRAADTPPTPPVGHPLMKSRAFLPSLGGMILAAPAMLKEMGEGYLKPIMDALQPFTDQSPAIHATFANMATVAAVLAAVGIAFQVYNSHRARN